MNRKKAENTRLLLNQIEATENIIKRLNGSESLRFIGDEIEDVDICDDEIVFEELKEGAIAIFNSGLIELNDRLNKMS